MRVRYTTPQSGTAYTMPRFDSFFDDSWSGRSRTSASGMAADVYKENDTYFVDIDLPGVALADIDIEIEKNMLTVSATRPVAKSDDRTVISRGRPFGSSIRRFHLSNALQVDTIEATLDEGVLTLRIPVAEESKARKIEISTGEAARQIEG